MLPNAAFSHTKCVGPTITPTGSICIIFVCWTPRMNPSTQSAQSRRSMYFVGITTAYYSAWRLTTQWWVFLHLFEPVNNASLLGRCSWNHTIWFSGVYQRYNTGKEGICPWKVLLRSFSSLCLYWTQILWASCMIPWLALVYSTLQYSPRCSTDISLWNGWPGCRCCLRIGLVDRQLHPLVSSYLCRPAACVFGGSVHYGQFFGEFASGTGCIGPDFVQ